MAKNKSGNSPHASIHSKSKSDSQQKINHQTDYIAYCK